MIRRLRRFILITGTLLSVLIAAAFVTSLWSRIIVVPFSSKFAFVCVAGGVRFVSFDRPTSRIPLGVTRDRGGFRFWNVWRYDERTTVSSMTSLLIPQYALLAVVAIPTLLAWRFWPKPPKPGHCRCGYDLTGNTSGVCPECGVEVQA